MNNGWQMTLAWQLYAQDENELLVKSLSDAQVPENAKRALFCDGSLDYSNSQNNWNPSNNIARSPLERYDGNSYQIWKCPSDIGLVSNNKGQKVPRVREANQ